MSLVGSGRRLLLALALLIATTVVAAAVVEPNVADPTSIALAAALIAPPIVALGALLTAPFDDDAYLDARWPGGIIGDTVLIGAVCGVAAMGIVGAATAIDRPRLALPAATVGTYLVAMAVFTVRNMTFYEQASA